MDLDETTIAEVFKSSGYVTGAYGKWHNGMQFPYHPNARGFDDFYGFCSGHWGNYFSPMLEHNNEIVKGEGFCIDDFTNKAMDFMETAGDKPFFLYIPFNTPHSPMQVPDKYWDRFKDKELKLHARDLRKEIDLHTRCALAMCENIDDNVGRILEKLDDLGKTENTIIVYFCDNGPNGWRWNGDMKGKKGSVDEGGVRSPLLVRWPEKIAAGTVIKGNSGAIDLLPTLAELAGIKAKTNKPMDGRSIAPLLRGEPVTRWGQVPIFSHWKGKLSVKYDRFRMGQKDALYDLEADPGQRTDVAKKHPKTAGDMKRWLVEFNEDVVGELPETDERPFVIAHPGHPNTQIPARDGKAHGAIERSARAPNCSYFRNWINMDDKITWDVEVGASGEYEVDLYYACPKDDLGSEIELSCGTGRLVAKINEAHDPPLRGASDDRFGRGSESYVKDFIAKTIGTIHLEKGKGILALKALKKPGKQVMEFRLLVLKRVAGKL